MDLDSLPRFAVPTSADTGSQRPTPSEVRLDAHQIGCDRCHDALKVATPAAFCVAALCTDGARLLGSALHERRAARLVLQ